MGCDTAGKLYLSAHRVAAVQDLAELRCALRRPLGQALDPVRPPNTRDGRWHTGQTQVLSISELQDFEDVFYGISAAARSRAFSHTSKTPISAGETPDILEAWPTLAGF